MATKKASKEAWKTTKLDPRAELEGIASRLNGDELRILIRIGRRLLVGLERYGAMRLSRDKRDYRKEAAEELLDWLVYTEMDLEREAQRKSRLKMATPKGSPPKRTRK